MKGSVFVFENLIVELSGDKNRLTDRISALTKFAQGIKKINIYAVINYGHEYLLEKVIEEKSIDNIEVYNSTCPEDIAIDLLNRLSNAVLVSAGDTNTIVTKSFKKIKTIYRKTKPILANTFPKIKGHVLVADIGATIKPDLFWVALVCRAVAESIYGKSRLAMLNIGEENYKGEKDIQELNQKLCAILDDEFLGNREINVVVGDPEINALVMSGADGNKTIKAYEAAFELIRGKVLNSWWGFVGTPLLYLLKKIFLSELDWRVYSGAWLLGMQKPILVTHGRCDKRAFYNALVRATDPIVEKIWQAVDNDRLLNKHFTKRK